MIDNEQFQTPPWVCDIMVGMMGGYHTGKQMRILEPTPGKGNLVAALRRKFPLAEIVTPKDYWRWERGPGAGPLELACHEHFDWIAANPPFTPMSEWARYFRDFLRRSSRIVTVAPWFTVINSDRRTERLREAGLQEVVHLPRSTFAPSRVQCCILKFTPCLGSPTTVKLNFARRPTE